MFTKQFYPILAVLSLSILLISCATTGPGGKKSLILVPVGQEVAIGQGMAERVAQTEKTFGNAEWQQYLAEVGQKIVAVCDRRDIEYHFTVIESDQINAFAAPGGYIYFYTGLLREMKDESEMAAVMAHEISHVVARHSVKRIQAVLGVAAAYQLAFGSEGASEIVDAAINIGMGLAFSSYSRENEREADQYGLHYLVKAGYDPRGALGMYETLARLGGGGASNVFEQLSSTHPETKERIANARALIASMKPLPTSLTRGESRYRRMAGSLPAKAEAGGGK